MDGLFGGGAPGVGGGMSGQFPPGIDPQQIEKIKAMMEQNPELKARVMQILQEKFAGQQGPSDPMQRPAPPDANPNFTPFNIKQRPGMMGQNPMMARPDAMSPAQMMRGNPMMQQPTDMGPMQAPTRPAPMPGAPSGGPAMPPGMPPAPQGMPQVPNAPTNRPPLTEEEMAILRSLMQKSGMFR